MPTPSALPDPERDRHRSHAPWSPERPEALVVCCSDGRYHQHFEDYVRAHVGERPDMLALPGGPVGFDGWSASFDHERVFAHSLRLLCGSHPLRSIWLIAHEGCAFYRDKHGALEAAALRTLQLRDLARARARVLALVPGLEVHCVFARVDGRQVVFEPVAETPA